MTVCVAAICTVNEGARAVVGASDRMITAGFTETEPSASKIWPLSNSVFALVAGDMELQTALFRPIMRAVYERIQKEPANWWDVEEIAHLYEAEYIKNLQRRLERTYLVPLGLTYDTFTARQREMDPVLVNETAKKLREHRTESGVEVIFAGVDSTGCRILMWDRGQLFDRTAIGYASIGAGYSHADTEFVTAGHVPTNALDETFVLVHAAKKRAEAAPGVGAKTDMFMLGPELGVSIDITYLESGAILSELDQQYRNRVNREQKAARRAAENFRKYLTRLMSQASRRQEASDGALAQPSPGSNPRATAPRP